MYDAHAWLQCFEASKVELTCNFNQWAFEDNSLSCIPPLCDSKLGLLNNFQFEVANNGAVVSCDTILWESFM